MWNQKGGATAEWAPGRKPRGGFSWRRQPCSGFTGLEAPALAEPGTWRPPLAGAVGGVLLRTKAEVAESQGKQ